MKPPSLSSAVLNHGSIRVMGGIDHGARLDARTLLRDPPILELLLLSHRRIPVGVEFTLGFTREVGAVSRTNPLFEYVVVSRSSERRNHQWLTTCRVNHPLGEQ
jgi:hypothetical protein